MTYWLIIANFFCLSHLALSLRATYFELMEKVYGFIMFETVVHVCDSRYNILRALPSEKKLGTKPKRSKIRREILTSITTFTKVRKDQDNNKRECE